MHQGDPIRNTGSKAAALRDFGLQTTNRFQRLNFLSETCSRVSKGNMLLQNASAHLNFLLTCERRLKANMNCKACVSHSVLEKIKVI